MTNKKLDITSSGRELLKLALREAAQRPNADMPHIDSLFLTEAQQAIAQRLNAEMHRIYDAIIEEIPSEKSHVDSLFLTEAQQAIVTFSLRAYERNHGAQEETTRMLRQLTMSRREWRNWQLAHDK